MVSSTRSQFLCRFVGLTDIARGLEDSPLPRSIAANMQLWEIRLRTELWETASPRAQPAHSTKMAGACDVGGHEPNFWIAASLGASLDLGLLDQALVLVCEQVGLDLRHGVHCDGNNN